MFHEALVRLKDQKGVKGIPVVTHKMLQFCKNRVKSMSGREPPETCPVTSIWPLIRSSSTADFTSSVLLKQV